MPASKEFLQSLLAYGEQDLQANRRGRLSKTQITDLQTQAHHEMRAVLIVPFVMSVGILTLVNFWAAFPALIIIGLVMLGLYTFHVMNIEAIADKQVVALQGRLTRVARTNSITWFAIDIAGQRFAVDRDFYYQVPEGNYTVYVLEDRHLIVGMEPAKSRTSTKTSSTAVKTAKSSVKTPKKSTTKASSTTPRKSSGTKSTTGTGQSANRQTPAKTRTTKTTPRSPGTKTSQSAKGSSAARKPAATSSSTSGRPALKPAPKPAQQPTTPFSTASTRQTSLASFDRTPAQPRFGSSHPAEKK